MKETPSYVPTFHSTTTASTVPAPTQKPLSIIPAPPDIKFPEKDNLPALDIGTPVPIRLVSSTDFYSSLFI